MKYDPLRLQKKFDNINTNKNKFMTLKEAVNYAKTQQPNGLRPINKQCQTYDYIILQTYLFFR